MNALSHQRDAEGEAFDMVATTLHTTLHALGRTDASVSYETIGARTRTNKQRVNEWCHALYRKSPTLVRVVMMGPKVAPAILRALATAIETQAREHGAALDLQDVALDSGATVGRLMACVREILADKRLTLAEIDRAEAIGHEVGAEGAKVLAACAQARVRLNAGGSR